MIDREREPFAKTIEAKMLKALSDTKPKQKFQSHSDGDATEVVLGNAQVVKKDKAEVTPPAVEVNADAKVEDSSVAQPNAEKAAPQQKP